MRTELEGWRRTSELQRIITEALKRGGNLMSLKQILVRTAVGDKL